MSERSYYRHKAKIHELKDARMRIIAKVAYEEQHLERIDRVELIEHEMWLCYSQEKDPCRKVKILSEIAAIQPYVSTYYEATMNLVKLQDDKLKTLETSYRDPPPVV